MNAAIHPLPYVNRRSRSGEFADARDFIARAEKVSKIAAEHANAVDRDARFPHEAFKAIRDERLLSMLIPTELGGEGARAADVADVSRHPRRGVRLDRHDFRDAPRESRLPRPPRSRQRMAEGILARRGARAVPHRLVDDGRQQRGQHPLERRRDQAQPDARVRLERDASCISYGAEADAIVTTARRADAASSSDQVLAVFRRSDYTLDPTKTWDTLGMRGTCSVGYMLRAEGFADQVLSEPYERVHNLSMVPYAHILWAATWQGVANAAFSRARAFVRQAARQSGGRMPPGAQHLTYARVSLETLRGALQAGLATFDRHAVEPGGLTSMNAQLALNFLKVEASELAAQTVLSAMRATGLAGYRNDSEFSMGRYLRDILSSPIMIHNDRVLANSEAAVLMSEPPLALSM